MQKRYSKVHANAVGTGTSEGCEGNAENLTYKDRKRVHNLKYFTWVEQQGKTAEELNALWYDTEGTWDSVHREAAELDELIRAFNEETGVLKTL